jgi:hypothetical protein
MEGVAYATDPTMADCVSAVDASTKLSSAHKLRAERSQLLVCAAATCPTDIRKECGSRIEEVNAKMPTIAFQVKDATGADADGVKVTMDGEVLTDRLQGMALSMDPGEHMFTFEVAGQPPLTRKLVLVEGQKDRRETITLGAVAPVVATVPAVAPRGVVAAPVAPTTPATPAAEEKNGMGGQKVAALVIGSVGVAGLAVGAVAGAMAMAMAKKSTAQNECPDKCATQAGANDWSSAGTLGNVSTAGFVVGLVGVAGGATLWFTAPKSSGNPQVGAGPGYVALKGVW